MGAAYRYECDRCGHVVETSGLWDFYRDGSGKRKPFGHPVPASWDIRYGRAASPRRFFDLCSTNPCPTAGATLKREKERTVKKPLVYAENRRWVEEDVTPQNHVKQARAHYDMYFEVAPLRPGGSS